MGLLEFLTKPIGFNLPAFAWREPMFYRLRLQGNVLLRLLLVAGAWAAATGVFCVLFAFNVNPPGLLLAAGLGLVFGFGPAGLLLFGLKDQTSGRVTVNDDGIRRHRTYAGLGATWSEWSEWPFDGIRSCVVVPDDAIEQPFSVLLISAGDAPEIIGIPSRVDLPKLAKFLKARGVEITKGESIPGRFTKSRFNLPIVAAALGVAFVCFTGGLAVYGFKVLRPPDGRQHFPHAGDNDPAEFPQADPAPDVGPAEAPANDDAAGATRTELAGGAGGEPFTRLGPVGQPVLGFRYTFAEWAGRSRLGSIEPVYDRRQALGAANTVIAPVGYAVGAIMVDASDFVDAFAVVFMRINPDGRLNPADHITSEGFGTASGKPLTTLGGTGAKVIGIHGRGAGVVDALGLVLEGG